MQTATTLNQPILDQGAAFQPLWTFAPDAPDANWNPIVPLGEYCFLARLFVASHSKCDFFRLWYDGSRLYIRSTPIPSSVMGRRSGSLTIVGKATRSTMDSWKLLLVNLKPLSLSGSTDEPLSIIFPEVDATYVRPREWDRAPISMFDELSGRLAFCTSFKKKTGAVIELIEFA